MNRFIEDALRIARGAALVSVKAAADSSFARSLVRGNLDQQLQAAGTRVAQRGKQAIDVLRTSGQHTVFKASRTAQRTVLDIQEKVQTAASDVQVQSVRTAEAAQDLMQYNQQQLQHRAQGAVDQVAHIAQQMRTPLYHGFVPTSTQPRNLRGHAATGSDTLPSVGQSGLWAEASQPHPPFADPTPASSTSGFTFDPSSRQQGSPLVHASGTDSTSMNKQSTQQAPGQHDTFVQHAQHLSEPNLSSAPNDSKDIRSEAKVVHCDIAKPPLVAHTGNETSPVKSPITSPVEALAAAQSSGQKTSAKTTAPRRVPLRDALATNEGMKSEQPLAAASSAPDPATVRRKLRQRRVPSSQLGRVAGFAGLGASLAFGTVKDSVFNFFGPKDTSAGSSVLSEANADRLANALCRMRGAALKLGQMLSIQDENVLPPQFSAALEKVRAGADTMPPKQLARALAGELGNDWRSKVREFEEEPLAAASIGQVHQAVTHDGRTVVMKIQYPGVAKSIRSDVDNLLRLVNTFNLLPEGLYVRQAAEVAKDELTLECDYEAEANAQRRMKALVEADLECAQKRMYVPGVVPELSTPRLLTSEKVAGVAVDQVRNMSQEVRNDVGTKLLMLTLKELFEWRFMQTDPNFANVLYDEPTGTLNLIDFGASREFNPDFVAEYLEMVRACAERNTEEVLARSTAMGFLTGDESQTMKDAHCQAGFLVGVPFAHEGDYDFKLHGDVTKRIGAMGMVMVKERLVAPPREAYSLHRKLSGTFLTCIKLGSVVPCRQLFLNTYERAKLASTPAPIRKQATFT